MTGHPDYLKTYRHFRATELLNVQDVMNSGTSTSHTVDPPGDVVQYRERHVAGSGGVTVLAKVKTPTGETAYTREVTSGGTAEFGAPIRPVGGDVEFELLRSSGALQLTAETRVYDLIGVAPKAMRPRSHCQFTRRPFLPPGNVERLQTLDLAPYETIHFLVASTQPFTVTGLITSPGVLPGTALLQFAVFNQVVGAAGTIVATLPATGFVFVLDVQNNGGVDAAVDMNLRCEPQ